MSNSNYAYSNNAPGVTNPTAYHIEPIMFVGDVIVDAADELGGLVKKFATFCVARYRRNATVLELSNLEDWVLDDIGLARADIRQAADALERAATTPRGTFR